MIMRRGRKGPTVTTPPNILVDFRFLSACQYIFSILNLEGSTADILVTAVSTQSIHGSLEGIVLPAKKVICVLAVAGPVLCAQLSVPPSTILEIS